MRRTESLPRSCAIDCATRVFPAPVPPARPIRMFRRCDSGAMGYAAPSERAAGSASSSSDDRAAT